MYFLAALLKHCDILLKIVRISRLLTLKVEVNGGRAAKGTNLFDNIALIYLMHASGSGPWKIAEAIFSTT